MQIGYMRISKGEQTTALQEDALAKALVERTYRDVMSGVRDDRPQFQAMLDFARPGDTIVVWRLDRLGRSLTHLIETVMGLQARGINFRSLTEHVDTSTRDRTRSQRTRREKDRRRPRDAKMKAEKRKRRGASLVIAQMKEPSFGQDHCFSRPGISLCDLIYCQRETGANRYFHLFLSEK